MCLYKKDTAWPVWLSGWAPPGTEAPVLCPVRGPGTCPGCGLGPQEGRAGGSWAMFLSVFPSSCLSLKSIKNIYLKEILNNKVAISLLSSLKNTFFTFFFCLYWLQWQNTNVWYGKIHYLKKQTVRSEEPVYSPSSPRLELRGGRCPKAAWGGPLPPGSACSGRWARPHCPPASGACSQVWKKERKMKWLGRSHKNHKTRNVVNAGFWLFSLHAFSFIL